MIRRRPSVLTPEVVWSGVSGQISKLESVVNQRHKLMRAEMSTKVAGVEKSVAKVEGKVDALDAKLCGELAELKAMLAELAGGRA